MNSYREEFVSRRSVLSAGGTILASSLGAEFLPQAAAQQNQRPPLPLPPFNAPTERQGGPPPEPLPPDQRIGIAVVGLGRLSVEQILPAFAESKKAKPVALVSGNPEKARRLAQDHGIPERSVYDYKNFDRIRDNQDVQGVYTSCCRTVCTMNTSSAPCRPASMCCVKSRWRTPPMNRKR